MSLSKEQAGKMLRVVGEAFNQWVLNDAAKDIKACGDQPLGPLFAAFMAGAAWGATDAECRVCGCRESNCSQCVEATGEPCHWVEDDLCSRCAQ